MCSLTQPGPISWSCRDHVQNLKGAVPKELLAWSCVTVCDDGSYDRAVVANDAATVVVVATALATAATGASQDTSADSSEFSQREAAARRKEASSTWKRLQEMCSDLAELMRLQVCPVCSRLTWRRRALRCAGCSKADSAPRQHVPTDRWRQTGAPP